MDPVTSAIVAALAAGANKIGQQVIIEGYTTVKDLLKKKFGSHSEITKAIENLEAKPGSPSRQGTLQEEIVAAKAEQDPEILKAAQALLKQIAAQQHDDQITQNVIGNYNAAVQGTGTATVNVNHPSNKAHD